MAHQDNVIARHDDREATNLCASWSFDYNLLQKRDDTNGDLVYLLVIECLQAKQP